MKNVPESIGAQMDAKRIGQESTTAGQKIVSSRKIALRKAILELRGRMGKTERDILSREINRRALSLLKTMTDAGQLKPGAIIHLFRSFGEEVDTSDLLENIRKMGFRLAVPVICEENSQGGLVLSMIGEETLWKPGPFQIPQPQPVIRVEPDLISLFFLPGVAFDRLGNRLGYGKGYYDRLLSGLDPGVPRIALAFSLQVLESVPSSEWDIPVTMILTEEETIDCD